MHPPCSQIGLKGQSEVRDGSGNLRDLWHSFGGVGGLAGAIPGKQLEEEQVLKYERDLQAGKLLVIVRGTTEESEMVRRVMGESQGQDIETYQSQAA